MPNPMPVNRFMPDENSLLEPEAGEDCCSGNKAITVKYVDGLKDTGTRKAFGAGAMKEQQVEGKGAYHLMPWYPIRRVSEVYRKGATKYAPRNWEKGIPLSNFIDSAQRHLDQFKDGQIDEDHLHQAIWNLLGCSETMRRINMGVLPASLSDLPGYNNVRNSNIPFRKPGPGCELDNENDRDLRYKKQALKGKPDEEAFGRKLEKSEWFIPFVHTDKPEDF